jgi:hypothetical protein
VKVGSASGVVPACGSGLFVGVMGSMTFHFVAAKTLQELELIVNQALKQEYCRAGPVAFLNGEYVMELCSHFPATLCTPVQGLNGEVLWTPYTLRGTSK